MTMTDQPQAPAAPQPQQPASSAVQAPSDTTDEKFLSFIASTLGVEAPNFDFVTGVRRTVRFPSMEEKPSAMPEPQRQLPSSPPALPSVAALPSNAVPLPPGSDTGMS